MAVELCLRCGADMEWRHGTWQCPRCRLKLGCCEGEDVAGCETAATAEERRAAGEEAA